MKKRRFDMSQRDKWKLARHNVSGSSPTMRSALKGRWNPSSFQDEFSFFTVTRHFVSGCYGDGQVKRSVLVHFFRSVFCFSFWLRFLFVGSSSAAPVCYPHANGLGAI